MKNNILTKKELLEQSKVSERILAEWEDFKIIQPSGFTEDNVPFYNENTLSQIQHIKKLIDVGYGLEEIQRIVKKVGLPESKEEIEKTDKLKKHLTVGGLAERVGVSPRTLKHWEDKGIIEPDMRSKGGFRLYSEEYIHTCKLIKDLQIFGYTLDQIRKFFHNRKVFNKLKNDIDTYSPVEAENNLNLMMKDIDKLMEKINLLKEGIKRWEDFCKKTKKDVSNLLKKHKKREKEKGEKNE